MVTTALSGEEGAFLRGQVRMEERVDVPPADATPEAEVSDNFPPEAQPSADQPPA